MSYPSSVTIGILGSGNMGRALGLRYFQAGHQVFFGGRQPTEAPLRAAQLANTLRDSALPAKYGSLDEAAQFADVLIWTMRERDQCAVLSDVGVKSLDAKLILDLNNRDFSDEVIGGPEQLGSKYFERSLGQQLQANLPLAHVVKAFNTVAMEAPDTSPEKLRAANAQVFVAGCRASEKRGLANELVEELGFEIIDLGDGPTAVRIAEAMGDAVRYIMIENKKGGTANIGLRFLPKPNLGIVGAREQSSYH